MHTIPDSVTFLLRAGHQSGLGHWVRCHALAIELRRRGVAYINFVLPREPGQDRLTCASPARLVRIDNADADAIVGDLESLRAEAIILDLPDTSELLVHLLGKWPLASIGGGGSGRDLIQTRIDGMLPRPGYVDHFRGAFHYEGPEYIILRAEFGALRARRREASDPPGTVLIMLGGSDLRGWSVRIASLVSRVWPQARVNVILGPATNEFTPPAHSGVTFFHDPRHIAKLMADAEVAVLAGGMALYEAFCIGLPAIAIAVVPAQEALVQQCAEANLVEAPQVDSQRLADEAVLSALRRMTAERRCTLMANTVGLVDGQGTQRVAEIILHHIGGVNPLK